jgi:Coenzyme PQQ synthesis protein D (PqqD)
VGQVRPSSTSKIGRSLLRERALFRLIDDEAVILDMDRGHYLGLNHVATRIWCCLGNGNNSSQIKELLEEEFDVEQETLSKDVDSFLQELLDAGLLIEQEGAALVPQE